MKKIKYKIVMQTYEDKSFSFSVFRKSTFGWTEIRESKYLDFRSRDIALEAIHRDARIIRATTLAKVEVLEEVEV